MNRGGARKHIFSAFIFLLMILVLIPSLVYPQSESEPNDRQNQANEIGLGERISGYFQKNNDYDWSFSIAYNAMLCLVWCDGDLTRIFFMEGSVTGRGRVHWNEWRFEGTSDMEGIYSKCVCGL